MVRTRLQTANTNNADEIRERAQTREGRRMIDGQQSPRKRSAAKQKIKAKRDSMKFDKLLLRTKENLSKV